MELANVRRPLPWQQTPGGRIILGTLLALGLCYGLLQIGMAALRILGLDGEGKLNPLAGLIVFQALQVLALLCGGMLAGAGQDRGSVLGGFVGILTGVGVLAAMLAGVGTNVLQSYSTELLRPGSPTHDMIMFGLPVQNLIAGAIGGLIGCWVWRPLPMAADPRYASMSKKAPARREPVPKLIRWTGPIAWVRVLLGTGIALVGALNAPRIVDFVLRASENKLQVMTQLENQVAYGEVFGLSIILGGIFAGATRINGLKQGVCVAFLLSIAMVGFLFRSADENGFSVLFPILSALLLAPVGGWFGSELLPPVSRHRFRVRFWS
jgi:hypothetical protein